MKDISSTDMIKMLKIFWLNIEKNCIYQKDGRECQYKIQQIFNKNIKGFICFRQDFNHVIGLLNRFPDMDMEALKQQYPDVDIEKAKQSRKYGGHFAPR